MAGEERARVEETLNRLQRYIREHDGQAGRYLAEQRNKLAELPRDEMERLGRCLATFDYDAALIALSALAERSGIALSDHGPRES